MLNIAFLCMVALGASALLKVGRAEAQVASVRSCVSLPYNLRYGQYDSAAVSNLQAYLNAAGHMSYPSTGYFGPLTLQAVLRFQNASGIDATGFVGPITRARIAALTCGSDPVPPSVSAVKVYGISPSAGPVGTVITITGTGFTNDNTVRIGAGAVVGVPSLGVAGGLQTITIAIPSALGRYCPSGMYCIMLAELVSPGTYAVSVTNALGSSNAVDFIVTSSTPSGSSLSVEGIDAPSTLPLNTPGIWTVRVAHASGGTLHYSVLWGDEVPTAGYAIAAPQPSVTESSATFTHAYSRTGVFVPQFTVTDDFGRTVSVHASVLVTPIY